MDSRVDSFRHTPHILWNSIALLDDSSARTSRSPKRAKGEWTDVRLIAILIQGNYESHLSWEGRKDESYFVQTSPVHLCLHKSRAGA